MASVIDTGNRILGRCDDNTEMGRGGGGEGRGRGGAVGLDRLLYVLAINSCNICRCGASLRLRPSQAPKDECKNSTNEHLNVQVFSQPVILRFASENGPGMKSQKLVSNIKLSLDSW